MSRQETKRRRDKFIAENGLEAWTRRRIAIEQARKYAQGKPKYKDPKQPWGLQAFNIILALGYAIVLLGVVAIPILLIIMVIFNG